MVLEETKVSVFYRDSQRCCFCSTFYNLERTPHHCFFKSELFTNDRDEEWNLVNICRNCHFSIHHKGGVNGRNLEEAAKLIAYHRYEGKNKEKLTKILKSKKMYEKNT